MKLLVFTFSPVQGFIEKSRKLRDFFNSSLILSYITKKLIEKLKEDPDVEIIYPAIKEHDSEKLLMNYPNRLVAKFEKDKNYCEELKNQFSKIWEEIYTYIADKIKIPESVKATFKSHNKHYFTYFCEIQEEVDREEWMTELKVNEETLKKFKINQENPYGFTYDLLERKLGARKTFRPYYGRVDENKKVHGCTLCGERPALDLNWEELRKNLPPYHLDDSERLCGVCLTKRFFHFYLKEKEGIKDLAKFHSTRHFALAPLIKKVEKDKLSEEEKEILREILSMYTNNQINDGNLKELIYNNIDELTYKRVKALVRKRLDKIPDKDKEVRLKEFEKKFKNSYFSILMADGDEMGKWLGLKPEKRKVELTENFHKKFSEALFKFAQKITKIEDNICLKFVYLGGDDVLAVAHPSVILKAAKIIRKRFSEILKKELKPSNIKEDPTMSAGLVIAHEKENLAFVLEHLRTAERRAKNEGRNRLCISVIPHNSYPRELVLKWDNLENFIKLIEYFKSEKLSSRIPYYLRKELEIFIINEESVVNMKDIALSVIKRILKRQISKNQNDKKLNEYEYYSLITQIEDLINERIKETGSLKNALEYVLNTFYIARFIANIEGLKHENIPV